jgi:exosortase A
MRHLMADRGEQFDRDGGTAREAFPRMKLEHEELLTARGLGWKPALAALGITLAAILLLYRETALSMVALWASSDTYAHGYVIVPIALVLMWLKRRVLASIVPRPSLLGFVLLFGCGFVWLAAEAGQVQVAQQYAMSAMIPAAVVAIAGRQVAWALAFPLAFLLLAVPFGEAFLPRLMDWTANFTVGALQLTGIPVYREGNFFSIPSGSWSVVEACSGLRYLIASITVGALFAYVSYSKWWKRALFFALSIAVPIVANFLRAYMIVMIGHLSSMKLAVGIDHFVYGWVFFGVVIGLLFWIGSFWRDRPEPPAYVFPDASTARPVVVAGAAIGVVAIAAAWPLYANHLEGRETPTVVLLPPAETSGWTLDKQPALRWTPHYDGAAASASAVYRKGDKTVAVYLGHYRNQRQGAELVGAQNVIAGGKGSPWAALGESHRVEGSLEVRQTRLRSGGERLLVWDWYRIAGLDLSNPYLAKALIARDTLLGRGDASSAIALAAPYEVQPEAAAETLRLFLREMRPAIDGTLAAAHGGRG